MKYTSLLAILLFLFVSCKDKNAYTIELNLEKNAIYKQKINANTFIKQNMNGQDITINMILNSNVEFSVLDITSDSNYVLEAKYKSMSLEMQLPQTKMTFNSETFSSDDLFSQVLSNMKDVPFQVIMNKKGKILEVKNMDMLFESLTSQFPELGEEQKEMIKTQLNESFGQDAFKGNLELITAIFPEKPVQQNDSWNSNFEILSGSPTLVSQTLTFNGKNGKIYKIHGESQMKSKNKEEYISSNGIDMKYDLHGKMTSDIKLNVQTGWIESAKISQTIEGASFIKANPQMPEGLKIPMNIQAEMTVSN